MRLRVGARAWSRNGPSPAIAELQNPQGICDSLIDAANGNSGADNITVIVVEVVSTAGGVALRGPWNGLPRRGHDAEAQILRLEESVVNEYNMGMMATIGRLSDNSVMIDNAAVSGHHACVFRDGDQFVVEDLQSTNGTFVNGTRVSRRTLQPGDVVMVGKHQLVLDQSAAQTPP